MIDMVGTPPMGQRNANPGEVVLNCVRKQAEQALRRKPVSSFPVSASVPA